MDGLLDGWMDGYAADDDDGDDGDDWDDDDDDSNDDNDDDWDDYIDVDLLIMMMGYAEYDDEVWWIASMYDDDLIISWSHHLLILDVIFQVRMDVRKCVGGKLKVLQVDSCR